MEHIRQAVELAKARGGTMAQQPALSPGLDFPRSNIGIGINGGDGSNSGTIALDPDQLESMRIISHNVMDRRSKPYDMLRTQVLRTMDQQKWQLLAVTSPTPGCGKTLTAINLALSIARQPEKSVLLVDMDFGRPKIATSIGLNCEHGILSVLEGRTVLSEAVVQTRIGNNQMTVLPCETSTSFSSEWMASREMASLIQAIRRDYGSHVVVLDMPPILATDDVISILPQLDCVLLVAAVGMSTLSDVEQCSKHLQSAEVVRVVLNKTAEKGAGYYY